MGGVLTVLAAELPALFLWLVAVALLPQPWTLLWRWMALAFVAPVLLLRSMAHQAERPTAVKGAIGTLFVSFIIFIVIYLRLT